MVTGNAVPFGTESLPVRVRLQTAYELNLMLPCPCSECRAPMRRLNENEREFYAGRLPGGVDLDSAYICPKGHLYIGTSDHKVHKSVPGA